MLCIPQGTEPIQASSEVETGGHAAGNAHRYILSPRPVCTRLVQPSCSQSEMSCSMYSLNFSLSCRHAEIQIHILNARECSASSSQPEMERQHAESQILNVMQSSKFTSCSQSENVMQHAESQDLTVMQSSKFTFSMSGRAQLHVASLRCHAACRISILTVMQSFKCTWACRPI